LQKDVLNFGGLPDPEERRRLFSEEGTGVYGGNKEGAVLPLLAKRIIP
jgi:hypothetical protein